MSLQHQRLAELCNELKLGGVAAQYTALAQKAAEKQASFSGSILLRRSVLKVGQNSTGVDTITELSRLSSLRSRATEGVRRGFLRPVFLRQTRLQYRNHWRRESVRAIPSASL
jgi:hypothetical protein